MPSIKQKFYGIIRQFSTNTVVVGGSQDDDGEEVAGAVDVVTQNNSVLLINHHYINVEGASQGTTSGLQKPSSLLTNRSAGTTFVKTSSSPSSPTEHSFIYRYLTGRLKKPRHPEIYFGKTGVDLPVLHLGSLNCNIIASHSGPDGGLTRVPPVRKRPMANIANLDEELNLSFDADFSDTNSSGGCNSNSSTMLNHTPPHFTNGHKYNPADCNDDDDASSCASSSAERIYEDQHIDWSQSTERAYGLSTSLYECNPITKVYAGNPVADVFAVCARQNSCVLALADGVNWGEKSRLAARCAIRGAVEHLNESMYSIDRKTGTTLDVFHCLLGAFHAAHHLILQEGGALTTLCVVVICPLKDTVHWVACACNVGDSLAFVFSQTYGVREITLGSHDIQQMRDMRDAGGALGPVDGVNPELHNMTCSMTIVDPGDIVFITSDGVSDNFDPVVGKFCLIRNNVTADNKENVYNKSVPVVTGGSGLSSGKSPAMDRRRSDEAPLRLPNTDKPDIQRKLNSLDSYDDPNGRDNVNLPTVEAYQRHELMLLRMEDLLRNGVTVGDPSAQSARDLCENLINFATQLTMAKRRILEDPDLYQGEVKLSRSDQRMRRKLVRQKISEMPGKLDHATVVAYCVGETSPPSIQVNGDSCATTPEYDGSCVTAIGAGKSNSNDLLSTDARTLQEETPTPRRHQLTIDHDYYFDAVSSQNDEFSAPLVERERVFGSVELSEEQILANFVDEKLLRPVAKNSGEKDEVEEIEDDEEEIMLDEFCDVYRQTEHTDQQLDYDVEIFKEVSTKLTLAPINEAPISNKQLTSCTSCDSETFLVVFTTDSHTTAHSSELDSSALTPTSVIETCLETGSAKQSPIMASGNNEYNSTEEPTTVVTSLDLLNMNEQSSTELSLSDKLRELCDLTVSTTSTSNDGVSTATASGSCSYRSTDNDVFLPDNHAMMGLPLTRPNKGRSGQRSEDETPTSPFSRMLNQSYYLATSQEESLYLGCSLMGGNGKVRDSSIKTINSPTASFMPPETPAQQAPQPSTSSSITKQPSMSRFKKLSKTFERIERAVPFRKAKKHPRGSPQRHTVAVDSVQWQEYKKTADKQHHGRLPSETNVIAVDASEKSTPLTPNSPKRVPSLHIPWSPIRSLKIFKSFTSPRHSFTTNGSGGNGKEEKPSGQTPNNCIPAAATSKSMTSSVPAAQPANPPGVTTNDADKDSAPLGENFQVSHSTSDSQISQSKLRLESTV